jgi:Fur family ferric uptake transcriptional regulator
MDSDSWHGLRMTRQRRAILEALRRLESHPTGDQVYRAARRRLPHISLGTVYRNLELLSARGIIRKLDVAGSQRRFDAKLETHDHIRCLSCGRLDDATLKPRISDSKIGRQLRGYQVLGHHLEVVGLCPECRTKRRSRNKDTLAGSGNAGGA